jgi:hypothetical protein
MFECVQDSPGSEQGFEVRSCEHGNEHSRFVNGMKLLG